MPLLLSVGKYVVYVPIKVVKYNAYTHTCTNVCREVILANQSPLVEIGGGLTRVGWWWEQE